MKISIESSKTLLEIRNEIKHHFSHLDIAFFSTQHNNGQANSADSKLPYYLSAGSAGISDFNGSFIINPEMTVAEIEAAFEKELGLHAQILRKSGSIYLQTTSSDHFSISELNKQAVEAANFTPDQAEPEDYHEQE